MLIVRFERNTVHGNTIRSLPIALFTRATRLSQNEFISVTVSYCSCVNVKIWVASIKFWSAWTKNNVKICVASIWSPWTKYTVGFIHQNNYNNAVIATDNKKFIVYRLVILTLATYQQTVHACFSLSLWRMTVGRRDVVFDNNIITVKAVFS